ncbi:MAG: alpha/beta hydrolase [Lentisphaeria bacterium]|nr:alpha/beta hydrolase [Lentisphaeria bacterium]
MEKKTHNSRSRLLRLGLFCFALPATLLFLASCTAGCMADRIIFQPPRGTPQQSGATMLEVASGISIAVRFTPPPEGGRLLLYSHGNAEDLGSIRYRLSQYAERGYGIAAYDYEGYGASGGEPSEAAAYRDIERVWRWLTEERGIPPESIVIYGRSVGTGPSCYLAEKVNAGGLVLEAPFSSTFAVAGMGFLPFNRFPNIERIANIGMPLLIIHGTSDGIIPYSHGRKLFEAAKEPKKLHTAEGAGHNNILMKEGERYWQALAAFPAP